jgi:hypothetical protein
MNSRLRDLAPYNEVYTLPVITAIKVSNNVPVTVATVYIEHPRLQSRVGTWDEEPTVTSLPQSQ